MHISRRFNTSNVALAAVRALTPVVPEQDAAASFARSFYLRLVRPRAHEDVKVILNEKQC